MQTLRGSVCTEAAPFRLTVLRKRAAGVGGVLTAQGESGRVSYSSSKNKQWFWLYSQIKPMNIMMEMEEVESTVNMNLAPPCRDLLAKKYWRPLMTSVFSQ